MTDVSVRELTPALADDYLDYFDHDAFADNPAWSGCYCYLHHFPGTPEEWQDSDGADNRAAVERLIRDGRFNGLLAYEGEQPVGWCKADIRADLPNPDVVGPPVDVPYEEVGVFLCFNVAPTYRGRGIARELLETGCEVLARRGATILEGYPRTDTETSADNWHGPFALYERAGFEAVMEEDDRALMRKAV